MKLLAYIIGNNNEHSHSHSIMLKIFTKNLKGIVDETLKKNGMGDSQK